MKKAFTLILAMAVVFAGFAQEKSSSRSASQKVTAQKYVMTGMEERDFANVPLQPRSMMTYPSYAELSQTIYDWQSNSAQRNFTAVWPDGYAVMCYTQATDASYSDRGTGLAIWDPAVGEWEYTEARVEGVQTGFGSIARYKENGLVIAAHTSNDCRIFIVEDFREGNRDFGEGIVLPTTGDDGRTQDPCWPSVQCSGENLDIIHIMNTEYSLSVPYPDAQLYTRYENGEFTVTNHILPNLDANNVSNGSSNIVYFLDYDPAKPNRVGFILNNSRSDGKAVISEDNGQTWEDRVFFQHPGINETYEDWFFYPRWTDAAFDNDDNLHIVYEYNGGTSDPTSGNYYPGIGGIGYWSEILPKNELCLGGIGEVGQPFIMDTTYLIQDIYASSPYWQESDHTHDPLPEYIGDLFSVDENGYVLPEWDDPEGYFPSSNTLAWGEHGKYNSGRIAFPSMYYDKATNRVFAFWSSICGDGETKYLDGNTNQYFYRLFCNMSLDGGQTWEGTRQLITEDNIDISFIFSKSEMSYPQVIPYLYDDNDGNGEYLWLCFQNDGTPGTYVQYASGGDEEYDETEDDNLYNALKVYVNFMWDDVEENQVEAPATMMQVYPNPAQGSFTMELNHESDVNIFNAVGQLVKTYKSVKNLNVNLEAGIYFVQAGNQTKKVVVL